MKLEYLKSEITEWFLIDHDGYTIKYCRYDDGIWSHVGVGPALKAPELEILYKNFLRSKKLKRILNVTTQ